MLRAHGIPVTPRNHRVFQWIPEPVLVAVMRRLIGSDTTDIKIGLLRWGGLLALGVALAAFLAAASVLWTALA